MSNQKKGEQSGVTISDFAVYSEQLIAESNSNESDPENPYYLRFVALPGYDDYVDFFTIYGLYEQENLIDPCSMNREEAYVLHKFLKTIFED